MSDALQEQPCCFCTTPCFLLPYLFRAAFEALHKTLQPRFFSLVCCLKFYVDPLLCFNNFNQQLVTPFVYKLCCLYQCLVLFICCLFQFFFKARTSSSSGFFLLLGRYISEPFFSVQAFRERTLPGSPFASCRLTSTTL